MTGTHELGDAESRQLLESGIFGRVAFATPGGPQIAPVNYAVVRDTVVFRTTPYSALGTYGHHAAMVFEVDHVDHENGTGWSVLARGHGSAITDSRELAEIAATRRPQPWASGQRSLCIGLRWTELTGRRLDGGPTGGSGQAADLGLERAVVPS